MTRRALVLLLVLVVPALGAQGAAAAPVVDGVYDVSGEPAKAVAGPDGNVWVVLATGALARFTPAGVKTEFPLPGTAGAEGITVGPDGNLWVTAPNKVLKVPPADPATFTAFTLNDIIQAQGIVTGPDGNLWTASADKVIRIPPGNPTGETLFTLTSSASPAARGITVADGALWVADFAGGSNGAVVRVTTAGAQTPFPVSGGPQELAGSPGGAVLFTDPLASPQQIGRIAPGGQPQLTDRPQTDPFGVTFGPDGAWWLAEFSKGRIARVTLDGQVTTLDVSGINDPREVAAGPGSTLWVSLEQSKRVARITGVEVPPAPIVPPAPAVPPAGTAPDTTAPAVTALGLRPAAFRAAPGRLALGGKGRSRVTLALSEAATVRFTAERRVAGRRSGGRCVVPTRRTRRAGARCVRSLPARGSVALALPAGTSRLAFSGRLARALRPGLHRLVATPTDAAGNRGAARRATFTILPPRRR
jgi:virginiamycin B lyase